MAPKRCGGTCNNPHLSEVTSDQITNTQGFQPNSEDARSPWKRPPGQEFTHSLSTEYLSTYRADYVGTHKGFQMKYETATAPRKKKAAPQCFVTEMRHSYQQPQKLAKLKNNTSRYGCNTLHGVYAKGIVPNVVFGRIRHQETKKPLTAYSRHIGVKIVDNHGMLMSLQPREHHQLSGLAAGTDKQVLEAAVQSPASSSPAQKTEYVAAVHPRVAEYIPAWISEWPGPL